MGVGMRVGVGVSAHLPRLAGLEVDHCLGHGAHARPLGGCDKIGRLPVIERELERVFGIALQKLDLR